MRKVWQALYGITTGKYLRVWSVLVMYFLSIGFKERIKRFTFYGLANANGKVMGNLRGNGFLLTLAI